MLTLATSRWDHARAVVRTASLPFGGSDPEIVSVHSDCGWIPVGRNEPASSLRNIGGIHHRRVARVKYPHRVQIRIRNKQLLAVGGQGKRNRGRASKLERLGL